MANTVILDSTTAIGLPGDLFSQPEQRWLGVPMQDNARGKTIMTRIVARGASGNYSIGLNLNAKTQKKSRGFHYEQQFAPSNGTG